MLDIKINITDGFLKVLYRDTLQKPITQIFGIFDKAIRIILLYPNIKLDCIEHYQKQKLYHNELRQKCYNYMIESFGGEKNILSCEQNYYHYNYGHGVKIYFYNINLVNYQNLKTFPVKIFVSEKLNSIILFPEKEYKKFLC